MGGRRKKTRFFLFFVILCSMSPHRLSRPACSAPCGPLSTSLSGLCWMCRFVPGGLALWPRPSASIMSPGGLALWPRPSASYSGPCFICSRSWIRSRFRLCQARLQVHIGGLTIRPSELTGGVLLRTPLPFLGQ